MRSLGVVVAAPGLDDDPGLGEAVEDLTVEQLVAKFRQAGRIVALETLQESTSTYHLDWTYAYADKRNLTAVNDYQNAANNEAYGYTANGFLSSGSGPWGDLLFTYDGVGNRLSRTTDTGSGPITESYTIASGSNRMQSVATSGVTGRSFTHDAAGNLTQDQDIFFSQTKALTWNHPGQVASVTQNSVPRGAYTYDYLHRMVVRNVVSGEGTMHRLHDLDGNVIAEYTGAGYLPTEYVWMEDRPIALVAEAGTLTPQILWVHTDHQERPALMTDGSANVVWRAKYLPFGEVASLTGTAAMNYRFPGQWFQLEAGLTYNWHRHYDATTGRYVSPDPLGMPDGPSRFAYVGNSPLMYVDPAGSYKLDDRYASPVWKPGGSGSRLGGGLGVPVVPVVPAPAPPIPLLPTSCYTNPAGCPPCVTKKGTIVPLGTIAYVGPHNPPRPQHGIVGPHYNLYRANQIPRNCDCFWAPIGAVPPADLPAGAMPIEEFANWDDLWIT